MGIEVTSLSLVSIISILVMIGVIVFFYYKKWMMVYAIIFANFIVFFISMFFIINTNGFVTTLINNELAFRPIYLSIDQFPQLYTLFTSAFLHSTSVVHIIFNVLFFILIAPSFENRIGPKKFIAIYLITGVCAALSHALISPFLSDFIPFSPTVGLIGASGAIAGILGAYAVSYPKDKIFAPVYLIILRIPVLYAGLIFLLLQTIFIFGGAEDNVAYLAHIGGFISGIVVGSLLIKRKSEFDQPIGKRTYDYYTDEKLRKINFSKLDELATTPELKEILVKIENETIPQARDMWLEHFIEKTRCPVCNNTLTSSGKNISCEKCDFKTKY